MRVSPAREIYERIPDPYRGWIGARRGRRWLRAVRFANWHNSMLPVDAPAVSFYPMRLEPTAGLAHVLTRLGVRIGPFGAPAELTVAWETGTWLKDIDFRRLPTDALNRHCTDISKTTVDRVWAEIAGYSISLDPLWTTGPLVVKPDQNGARAGRVVDGPVRERKTGHVYEKLIDSRDGDKIWSTRVALVCGRVVNAYVKWRPYPHWFRGPEVTVPVAPAELFSTEEQQLMLDFARAIGMDYGELDVLREKESGLTYVVDANRTPVRPKGLDPKHDDAWFGPITDAFAELLKHG
jgi:hypothetical protein